MVSNDLIDARVAENKAQRTYDRTATLFSALVTLLAIAVPVAVGYSTLIYAQLGNVEQRALDDARFYTDQSIEALGECLDRPEPVRDLYCERFSSTATAAEELREIARSGDSGTGHLGIILLAIIFLAVVVGYIAHQRLVYLSMELDEAQVRRIKLEAEIEWRSRGRGPKVRYAATRRFAAHQRRQALLASSSLLRRTHSRA